MLNTIKRYSNTLVARILMGILIVSFGLSGITYVFTEQGRSSVLRVGSVSISTVDFDRAYRNRLNSFARQFGQVPTGEQALALGIPAAVISELASYATLDNLVLYFGIGASDEQIADEIAADPAFRGSLSGFDRSLFNLALQRAGYTPAEYTLAQADGLKRRQLMQALFAGFDAPATILEFSHRFRNDSRTIDYFTLDKTALNDIASPTDEQLAQYLTENRQAYRTTEVRNIDLLVLTPETLGMTFDVTDAEIEAEYQSARSAFVFPATREVKTLTVADATRAELAALTENPAALERKIAEPGVAQNVIDLGRVSKDAIEDSVVANSAFDLSAPGATLVERDGTTMLVIARNFQEGGLKPLSQVRDEVAGRVRVGKAKKVITDRIDEIEDLRATLKPVKEIAAQFGLETKNIEVTPSGREIATLANLPPGAVERLLPQIQSAESDRLLPAVSLGARAMAWFDLNRVTPARDQTLDEVRQRVVTDWTRAETDKALAALVQEMQTALADGNNIEELALSAGKISRTARAITRQGDGDAITANIASATFAGGQGYTGAVETADGGYLLFRVTDVAAADTPLEADADQIANLGNSIADDLSLQFVAAMREEYGFSLNQNAVSRYVTPPARDR